MAVASRLSVELPDQCILVIEAGPAAWTDEKINIPGRKGSTLAGPYDWNFTTVAQPGHEIGRAGTRLLIEEIRGLPTHEHQSILVDPRVIVRGSSVRSAP